MLTIYADVHHTRRKKMTHICGVSDTLLWSGQTVMQAIEWLHEQGEMGCRVDVDGEIWLINFQRSSD